MKSRIFAAAVVLLFALAAAQCKKLGPEPVLPDSSSAPDKYEPDNNTINAKTIVTNGIGQYHDFFTPCDYDYVKFTAAEGSQYTIETSGLEAKTDTYMYLIDRDGASVIVTDDDGGSEPRASMITWVCQAGGDYFVRVQQYNCLRIYGPGTGYKISVRVGAPYTPTASPTASPDVSATCTPSITMTGTDTPFVTPTQTATITPMPSLGQGLWHQVSDYSARVPGGNPVAGVSPLLWWYGQDSTGNYDTGAANRGEFFAGPFYVNAGDSLRFWSYELTENFAGYDTRKVYISDSMTGNWLPLAELFGTEQVWYMFSAAVPAQYAGQNVYFRFVFDTVDIFHNDFPGWFIDDISVGP